MTDLPQSPAPASVGLLEGLGPRAVRRMTPRAGIALAGAGSVIAVAGAIGVGGDHLVGAHGDIHRIPGIIVSLALMAVGIFLLSQVRSGPIAVAGATAEALGVPALVLFATVDNNDFPPFNFDAVLLVSAVVWLIAYVVPPSRGRVLFLALGLIALPLFVMEEVEEISQTPVAIGAAFTGAFFGGEEAFQSPTFDDQGNVIFDTELSPEPERDPEPDLPDPTNLGIIAMLFGAAYAVGSFVLSRRHYVGTATPLSAIGAVSLVVGVLFLSSDLEEIGTGLLLVAIGLGLAFVGASSARRFTTWFGAIAFGLGVVVLVGKATDGTSARVGSFVFLVVGAAVVAAAHVATTRLGEPAEEDERRSFRPELAPLVAVEEAADGQG